MAVPPAAVALSQSERPLSMALTTQTEVDRVVQDSHFHDDALCQMLDAARMERLGEEARRALRRAARQRVHQLKHLHVIGKVSFTKVAADDGRPCPGWYLRLSPGRRSPQSPPQST
jgi:hypothetical protein